MNAQYVKLSMIPSGVMPTLYVSQYDVGRPLGLIVTNGTELVDMDSYSVTIEATRSDGTQITAAVTTADNIGTFQTTATMTNVAGIYKAQLVIAIASGKRIASIPFLMNVTAAAMDENGQGIAEDQSLYQQYTGTVQTLIATIRADLNTEIANRQSAVSAEAAARQTADNTLQSNINSEASTRAAADQNLQAQISQIVAPSGEAPSAAEVQNARVGADGVTYPTLGEAIRANDSQLKSQINGLNGVELISNWNGGKYINTSGDTVDRTALISASEYRCAVVQCVEGDIFTITATGGNAGRAWTFINGSGVKLSGAAGGGAATNKELVAPAGSSYLIINDKSSGASYKGKRTYDEIVKLQDAVSKTFNLEAESSVTIPDSSDFNTYINPGTYKVTNNVSAGTMLNMPINVAGKLIVIQIAHYTKVVQWYIMSNADANARLYVRFYGGESAGWTQWQYFLQPSDLDTANIAAFLMRGDITSLNYTTLAECTLPGIYTFNTTQIASITDMPSQITEGGYLLTYVSSNRTWQELVTQSAHLIRYATSGVWTDLNNYILLSYESGSGVDSSTERINIDIPNEGKRADYFRYKMAHCIDASINSNVWRLNGIYRLLSSGSESAMTMRGEFECAVHLADRDDFSGGFVHGDEVDQNVTFFADGLPVTMETLPRFCREFRVVKNSNLYDPADSATVIAKHGAEYIYTAGGLRLNQSIKWVGAHEVTNCYLAMFPIQKLYSQYRYDDTGFEIVENTQTNYGVWIPNAKSITEFGNGVTSKMSIGEYPTGLPGGDRARVTDNGGLNYNKLYFVICTSGDVADGTLWKSETIYSIV